MARLARVLTLFAVFMGCTYDYARTENLRDGEIHLTAVRADGTPASHVNASLQASDRVTQGTAEGEVTFRGLVPGRWLVRVVEDDDGDGNPERGAYVPTDLVRAPVPKNLTDGCAGEPPNVTTSVLLGNVELRETGSIIGSVSLDVDGGNGDLADTERARVVVWRDIDGFATAVEAAAGTSPDSSFRIDGVLPGRVHVAAYVFDVIAGANAPELFGHVEVDVVSGGEALADVLANQDTLLEGGARRLSPVQMEGQWTLPEPPTVDVSQVAFSSGAADIPGVTPGPGFTVDEEPFVIDAPIGVVDILLGSSTQGAADGLFRGAAIIPPNTNEDGTAPLGPVEFPLLADRCATDVDGERDCDHDGILGLPFPSSDPDAEPDPTWVACADACADAFGAEGARATCEVANEQLDCDDDGDGQPDVTEPVSCFGPGVGTDLDADDLCEPFADPFPYCAGDDCVVAELNTFPPSRY